MNVLRDIIICIAGSAVLFGLGCWSTIWLTDFLKRRSVIDPGYRKAMSAAGVRRFQAERANHRAVAAKACGVDEDQVTVGRGGPGVILVTVPRTASASAIQKVRTALVAELPDAAIEIHVEREP